MRVYQFRHLGIDYHDLAFIDFYQIIRPADSIGNYFFVNQEERQ